MVKKHHETGRSMVEMLGVLAVMGVLSVGSIAGYRQAMDKHRSNTLLSEASKRAQIVAGQLFMGSTPSLAEFTDAENTFDYGKFSSTVIRPSEDSFGITVTGVKKSLCKFMKSAKGGKSIVREFQPAECQSVNSIILIYDNELKTDGDIATDGLDYCQGRGTYSDSHGCSCYSGYCGIYCENGDGDERCSNHGGYDAASESCRCAKGWCGYACQNVDLPPCSWECGGCCKREGLYYYCGNSCNGDSCTSAGCNDNPMKCNYGEYIMGFGCKCEPGYGGHEDNRACFEKSSEHDCGNGGYVTVDHSGDELCSCSYGDTCRGEKCCEKGPSVDCGYCGEYLMYYGSTPVCSCHHDDNRTCWGEECCNISNCNHGEYLGWGCKCNLGYGGGSSWQGTSCQVMANDYVCGRGGYFATMFDNTSTCYCPATGTNCEGYNCCGGCGGYMAMNCHNGTTYPWGCKCNTFYGWGNYYNGWGCTRWDCGYACGDGYRAISQEYPEGVCICNNGSTCNYGYNCCGTTSNCGGYMSCNNGEYLGWGCRCNPGWGGGFLDCGSACSYCGSQYECGCGGYFAFDFGNPFGFCACTNQWGGLDHTCCGQNCCNSDSYCNNHGTTNWLYPCGCLCETGWEGSNCNYCGSSCGPHGRWNSVFSGCICDPGYCGWNCNNKKSCYANGHYTNSSYVTTHCLSSDYRYETCGSDCCIGGCGGYMSCTHGTAYPWGCKCNTFYGWGNYYNGWGCTRWDCGYACGDGYRAISQEYPEGVCICNNGSTCNYGYNCCDGNSGSYNACSGHGEDIGCGCLCYAGWGGGDYRYGQGSACNSNFYSCCGGRMFIGSDGWWNCTCDNGSSCQGYNCCSSASSHGTTNWAGSGMLCEKGWYGDPSSPCQYCGDWCNGHGRWAVQYSGCICDAGYCGGSCRNSRSCSGSGKLWDTWWCGTICLSSDYRHSTCGSACCLSSGSGLRCQMGQQWSYSGSHGCLCNGNVAGYCGAYACNYRAGYSWCGCGGRFFYSEYYPNGICICRDGHGASCCGAYCCDRTGGMNCHNGTTNRWGCRCNDGWGGGSYYCGVGCNSFNPSNWCSRNGNGYVAVSSDFPYGSSCVCTSGSQPFCRGAYCCDENSGSYNACSGHGTYVYEGCGCLCDSGWGYGHPTHGSGCSSRTSDCCGGRMFVYDNCGWHCQCNNGSWCCGSGCCTSSTSNPCSGHGTDLGYGCLCNDGWGDGNYRYGTACSRLSYPCCGGRMFVADTSYCECFDGRTCCGSSCCLSNGTYNWGGCGLLCDKGWGSSQCDYNYDECHGHGRWAPAYSGCVCDPGYCGARCENTRSCSKSGKLLPSWSWTSRCLTSDYRDSTCGADCCM